MTAFSSVETLAPRDWTDLELLPRLLLKDGKAWREFHRRFDRLAYRCIQKVADRFVGAADVEEIFACFLVRISQNDFRKLRQYRPDGGAKFATWIGMIATNVAWDQLRSQARRPAMKELANDAPIECSTPSPFAAVAARESVREVQEALAGFSERDRRFVELYFIEGLSPSLVAESMQVSVKTIYSKKHKIRARLRVELRAARPRSVGT